MVFAVAVPVFFEQSNADEVIDQLANADDLTFVVGAGVSMECGLPSWNGLVEGLLKRVARGDGLSGDDIDAFVDWTMREGPTAAAGMARARLPEDDFTEALRDELYGGSVVFAPGATAQAITRARLAFGADRTQVATTNYDLLLEDAAIEAAGAKSLDGWDHVPAVVSLLGEERSAGVLEVQHLHGVLSPDGGIAEQIVLAEGDYHLMQQPGQWQERWFAERLANSTVVFVGMSLTDPNLLRYLYRADNRGGGRHVAVFSRQDDAARYGLHSNAVIAAREAAVEARWRGVDVRALRCDYYTQSSQLVFEVASRRRQGANYRSLPERLAAWSAELSRGAFSVDVRTFRGLQDQLQELLADAVEGIVKRLKDLAALEVDEGERIGASLWLYRPQDETLVNWASSDRAWRDPTTMEPVPVEWDSPYASVRAFCSGSVAEHSTVNQVATRWNHVLGAPLWLDDDVWGRLPAGVLTVASTAPHPRSILSRGLGLLRGDVLPPVTAALSELLHP